MTRQLEDGAVTFSLSYKFFDEQKMTELSMFINGENILAFEKDGKLLTTRWNLEELALWLRNFLNNMSEDPYPVDCEGEFAAQKDDNARNFDTDDEKAFDEYYDKIDEWNTRHRWHAASSGAILADIFFQVVGENVEISWDNRNVEEGVTFQSESGGVRILRKLFFDTVDAFLKDYADHWYSV
jgi:hypothetical protein